jgi:hypothetical protein
VGDGSNDTVTLGDGNDDFEAGSGLANVLILGTGHDHVHTGSGWTTH